MVEVKTDVWQAQARLGHGLLRWGGLSMGAGAIMALLGDRFWRGFGSQCAGWGLIDGIIGWVGLRSARQKASGPEAQDPAVQAKARTNLRRVLWINAGLDVGYVAGGVRLARTKGSTDRFAEGTGWGIAAQGLFLFFFDLVHALLLG
ncbi:MAG: DUF6992 family protein [Anaerolineae bacterium]